MHALVLAATQNDLTNDVARALARHLAHHGLDVDVRHAEDVGSLDEWGAVMIGCHLRRGSWPREGRHVVRRLADELAERPTWMFSIGRAGRSTTIDDVRFSRTIREIGVRGHRVLVPHPSAGQEALNAELAGWAQQIAVDLDVQRVWLTGGPARLRLPSSAIAGTSGE